MSPRPDVHAVPFAESYDGGRQPEEDRLGIEGRAGTTLFPCFLAPEGAPPSEC